jgi:uncharacterized protein YdbL (DUF1318 family)
MIHLQNAKFQKMIVPIDANGTTVTDTEVDTLGYDYLTVIVQIGVISANMTALKLQESDSSGSSEADFTGGAFTAPTAAGGDNDVLVAFIDLRRRKRYISIVATAGANATLISAIGILSRAEVTPTSATERGIDEQIIP